MKPFQTISVDEMLNIVQDDSVMILDCRDTSDYRAGHIESAMHIHEKLRESLIKNGDKNRKMVIYCYHGHASEHVAEMFADFGFKHLYSLEGGYTKWQEHHQQKLATNES